MSNALQVLKALFADRPDVARMFDRRELDLQGLADEKLIHTYRTRQLYPQPINLYVTGRTGAGKSSLGNRFLDGCPLQSTGYQDCTSIVQFFRLASNLVYFDLPGSGSSDYFENINRAAVLVPQLEDEKTTDAVPILDFTGGAAGPKSEPTCIPLDVWASDQWRERFEPDAILYVVAPHTQWLRPDKVYLRDMLKHRKAANVVFALNLFRNDDGSLRATPQQIADAKAGITREWSAIHPTPPVIIEVNAKIGTGLQALAEALCRLLPAHKIGNMEHVLTADLKAAAAAERSRRYRRVLVDVAARLATFKVDATSGRDELLKETFASVCGYGVAVFHEEAAVREAQGEAVTAIARAAAADTKSDRAKAITVTVQGVEERAVTEEVLVGMEPEYDEEEVVEEQTTFETQEVKRSRSAPSRVAIGLLEGVLHVAAAPISLIQAMLGSNETENHRVRSEFRDSYSYTESVLRPGTRTVTRLEQRLVGFREIKETVTRMVPHVTTRNEEVGKEYLTGGSRVIEDVLALGMAVEAVPPEADLAAQFEAAVAAARAKVREAIAPLAGRIDAAAAHADPGTGEKQLTDLLTPVFVK